MHHILRAIWSSLVGLSLVAAGCGVRQTVHPDHLRSAIERPGKVEGHQVYLDYLLALEKVDPVQLENQKWIIDAFEGTYPQKWRKTHWSLASVLNHQAWHLVVNEREPDYAEALVNHSLSLEPNECDFLDTLAEFRFRQGAVKKALRIIRQAQKQKTDRGRPMGKSKRSYLEKQEKRFLQALK